MRIKGGMYCDRCDKPVAAQRSTHRLRGGASMLSAPLTGGVSLLGLRSDAWCCPTCGGPVKRLRQQSQGNTWGSDRQAEIAGCIFFGFIGACLLIAAGPIGQLFLAGVAACGLVVALGKWAGG